MGGDFLVKEPATRNSQRRASDDVRARFQVQDVEFSGRTEEAGTAADDRVVTFRRIVVQPTFH